MKKQYSELDRRLLAQAVGQAIPLVIIGLGVCIANMCGVWPKRDNEAVKEPQDKVQTTRDTIGVVTPATYVMGADSAQRSR